MIRRAIMCVCLLAILLQSHGRANACGPSTLVPIFVFKESSDLPLSDFAAGKIGIIQPTFGRKTLLIAYRYLNGGTFTPDEQEALVRALRGKPPEDEGGEAVELWVTARKEVVPDEKNPPEIYTEREYGGYDFFPNCTRNAFEVARQLLKSVWHSTVRKTATFGHGWRRRILFFRTAKRARPFPATLERKVRAGCGRIATTRLVRRCSTHLISMRPVLSLRRSLAIRNRRGRKPLTTSSGERWFVRRV